MSDKEVSDGPPVSKSPEPVSSDTPDPKGQHAAQGSGGHGSHDSNISTPSIKLNDEPEIMESPPQSPGLMVSTPTQEGASSKADNAQEDQTCASPDQDSSVDVPSASPESQDQATSLRDPSQGRRRNPRTAASTPVIASENVTKDTTQDKASDKAESSRSAQQPNKGEEDGKPSTNSINTSVQRAQELGSSLSPSRGTTMGVYGAPGSSRKGSHPMNRNSSFEYKETLDAKTRDLEDGSRVINQYRLCNMIGQGAYGCVYRAVLHEDPSVEVAIKEFGKTRLRKNKRQEDMRRPGRGGMRGRGLSGARGGRPSPSSAHLDPNAQGSVPQAPSGEGKGARHDDSPSQQIAKSRAKAEASEDPLSLIRHEIAILKKLHHPHLVQLYEVLDDPSRDSLYMVFEFCPNGPIVDVKLHKQTEPMKEDVASRYFVQIMLGMEYLHYHGIVHRDIKPDNILLLKEEGTCKIVDFGVSEFFFKPGDDTLKKSAGSPAFMSPELCKAGHGDFHGKQSDVWSLGVTLYCIVVGRLPFDEEHVLDLYQAVQEKEPSYPDTLSEHCVDFLKRMMCKDASKRITVQEMREHPWVLQDGKNEILPFDENIKDVVMDVTQEDLDKAIIKIASVFTFARAISKFKRAGSRGASITSMSDVGSSTSGQGDKGSSNNASSPTSTPQRQASGVEEGDSKSKDHPSLADLTSKHLHIGGDKGAKHKPQSSGKAEGPSEREPEMLGPEGDASVRGTREQSPEETMHDEDGTLKTKVLTDLPTVKSPDMSDSGPQQESDSYFGKQQQKK